jgi:cellobiose PTS system EIIB component
MKIMLVCAAGASSNVMAKAMNEAAKAMGRPDIKTVAHSEFEYEGYLEEVDAVLFGPHIKSMEKTFKEICDEYDVPSKCISSEAYGNLDGKKGVEEALELVD